MTEQSTSVNLLQDPSPPRWALTWACALAGAEPTAATRVLSNEVNQVHCLDFGGQRLFLKVGPRLQREYERLRWLDGRLPAPRPIGFTSEGGADALLMSAVERSSLAALSASLPRRASSRAWRGRCGTCTQRPPPTGPSAGRAACSCMATPACRTSYSWATSKWLH